MITGTVVIDLRDVEEDRMRSRCGAIDHAPAGARVVLHVGALKPDPGAVDVLRQRAHLHDIDVHGTAHAVRRWVAVLREGFGL
jgi:hypothetical protein